MSRDANPNLLTFSEYKENVSGCTLPMWVLLSKWLILPV